MPIVYVTTNKINGRKYLGKSAHGKSFYLGSGVVLQQSIKKYGKDAFIRKTLCVVETKEEAARIERNLSLLWNVAVDPIWYNIKIGGDGGSAKGQKRTKETKKRIADSKRGKPSWNAELAGKNDPRCKHSMKWKINHSKKIMGKRCSDKTKELMSIKATGRKLSQESKNKIRIAHEGRPLTTEHRQHISDNSLKKEYVITDPNGVESKIINLNLFCRTNDLRVSAMRSVVAGSRNNHRGWKARHV